MVLTDEPLPPPLDLLHLATEGRLDLVWLVAATIGAAYYVAGVVRLARRGSGGPRVAPSPGWPGCCCSWHSPTAGSVRTPATSSVRR
ncbi:hypothetical protein GCM10025866_12430 [Naasia aerilata]|uniref:Uncharacterized protein n=1 Tax=Naasia aerilata TaxID=1162966 RepID=A0ABN6XK75_9MICO|nr:hypothetical protein GCM10025866_12430 [Naasia aerilata]